MTEIFMNKLLWELFCRDIEIPEWGKWVAVDSDGNTCVFRDYPVLKYDNYDRCYIVWYNNLCRKQVLTTDSWTTLFYFQDNVPHTETQIVSVKDLFTT